MTLTENDLHYLDSILGHLREFRSLIDHNPLLGGEVLADNIDWLDCFICKHSTPKSDPPVLMTNPGTGYKP